MPFGDVETANGTVGANFPTVEMVYDTLKTCFGNVLLSFGNVVDGN